MYETYFNLTGRPFGPAPRVDQYFPATNIESARIAVARCIERAEGVGLVIGPSGTGKTLLCQLLAQQFKSTFQVALLGGGRLGSRRALLQAILYELGRPYRGMDEGELRLSLVEYVTLSDDCPHGVVLLVDEAHTLPLRLLDEIRTLTDLAHEGQPRVRLAMAGNRALEEHFASPKLDSFNQRVVARCYLESLNRAETQEYIHTRIDAAGGKGPRLIPAEACQSVYKATDGVPRLINQVCDHALLLAYASGARQLEPAIVEEAWADLQQLPMPWNEQAQPSGDVIEFGKLEDEPGDVPTPSAEATPDDDEAEASDSAALLHIATEANELDATELEPAEQLLQIQGLLAEVEEEFCPIGTIRPEVELVFDEPHPFQEPFQQEEVIADRYASPAAPAVAVPTVLPPQDVGEVVAPPMPLPLPLAQDVYVAPQPRWMDEIDADVADEDETSWPASPIAPAHAQKYGRLFSSLRHG